MTQPASEFSKPLLYWYARHARIPPWKDQRSPYAVWVAVVMLQQTRLETVIPYFRRWMERFPSIEELAAAPEQDVLALWEGLGYYRRALNLHRTAQTLVKEYHARLPEDISLLRTLPGIGRYAAGAIGSIAFGQDEPTLDGNIRRVLARYFNITEYIHTAASERILWKLAAGNLPHGHAGEYNQSLMDLGATICTPKKPDCAHCPLKDGCQAKVLGIQELLPRSLPRPAIPHHTVTAAVIRREGRVLIARRPGDSLLGGMWEFPGGKQQEGEDLATCLRREIGEELDAVIEVGEPLGIYKHAYTHYRVTLFAFDCILLNGEPRPIQVAEIKWVSPEELSQYPMGKIDRQISQSLVSSTSL